MLNRNVRFVNFKSSIKKNLINKKIKKIELENFLIKYPLLQSFTKNYKSSYKQNDIKKLKKFKNFNLIGMGGSILGTEAIYQFLTKKIKKNFNFINNLKPKLNQKKNSLNIIVSKSGETLETISNFHVLQKNKRNTKNIFISENQNSYLGQIAQNLNNEIFEHKNFIGGRYSVLSEVGMLPAELMGFDPKKFRQYDNLIKNKIFLKNLILNVESTIRFIKKGYTTSIILNYDEEAENLFKWYQQLIAESLGKKSKGLLPVISTMPKDNHSLLQLYLDGPKKNFFTFFESKYAISESIPGKNVLRQKKYLRFKKLSTIINAQKIATQRIFDLKKIPFRSFEILKKDETSLGVLFCFFVLETILLGRALNVNPFDQPSVELIKVETKKLLI